MVASVRDVASFGDIVVFGAGARHSQLRPYQRIDPSLGEPAAYVGVFLDNMSIRGSEACVRRPVPIEASAGL